MKKYLILIAGAMLMFFSSCQQNKKQPDTQNNVAGVYQYIDGREGISIMTDKYFLFTGRWKDDPSTVESEINYEKEYKTLFLEAGTYTMQDSIITCNLLFGKKPSDTGTSFRFTFTFKGDTAIFHVLNEDGEIAGTGATLRLKQSAVPNDLIGVYQPTGDLEGLSAMTEDYFIYAFRSKHEPAPADATDYYEKEYKSLSIDAGTYTLQDSIVTCNLMFARNRAYVGTSFQWTYSVKGDTIVSSLLNENGEVIGTPDYNIRLE